MSQLLVKTLIPVSENYIKTENGSSLQQTMKLKSKGSCYLGCIFHPTGNCFPEDGGQLLSLPVLFLPDQPSEPEGNV